MKYIDNKIENGIDYDWKKIFSEFNKLNIPKYVYNPCKLPLNRKDVAWFWTLSERSKGKTTNLLLLGMIVHKQYNSPIQYIRQTKEMLSPSISNTLFSTILKFNYVEKITDGKYNNVMLFHRNWFYIQTNENGIIEEKSDKPFMTMLCIEEYERYKSVYNAPQGDFIIVDEILSKNYYPNEFIHLCDLIMTIKRDRLSTKIMCLANMIDLESQYFHEFEIYEALQTLNVGEKDIIENPKGAKVFVEILPSNESTRTKERNISNKIYWGFKNQKLVGITGGDWVKNQCQHTPDFDFEILSKNIYVEIYGRFYALDICTSENVPLFIHIHKATKTYDDSVIYSFSERKDKRYRFSQGIGDRLDKFVWDFCWNNNLFYYTDNSIASTIEKYYEKSFDI